MGDTGPTPVLYAYNITGGAAGATYGGTGAFVQMSKFTFPGATGPFPGAHYAINWTLCEQVSPVPDASQVYIVFDDGTTTFMPRIIGTSTHPNFGAVMTPVSTGSGPFQLQTVSVADFVDLTAYDPINALNCFIYQRGSTGVGPSGIITLNQYYMSLQFMPIKNPTFSA
jgi:hypothetical protein